MQLRLETLKNPKLMVGSVRVCKNTCFWEKASYHWETKGSGITKTNNACPPPVQSAIKTRALEQRHLQSFPLLWLFLC